MSGGPMRFLFRADASTAIGSGHVVRCANLARALRGAGHDVQFVCRAKPGDLIDWLEAQGFRVHRIGPAGKGELDEIQDSNATARTTRGRRFDWLIVDHYDLGAAWEKAISCAAERVCVIDDLGRSHHCQLLLDQNYANPTHTLYSGRVPVDCELLLGPRFALLQPDFAKLRAVSLRRRRDAVAVLLVCMGGSDPCNETGKVLNGLARIAERKLRIDVAIGANNPNRESVAAACAALPSATLHVQTPRMAELMTEADCVICGGGNVTLERCALGLPGLVTIMADNQAPAAEAMAQAGAHQLLGWHNRVTADDYARAVCAMNAESLNRMSIRAAALCDGYGSARVAGRLGATAPFEDVPPRALHA